MKDNQTLHTNTAFPMFNQHGEVIHDSAAGLTKREYFAGLALQGLLRGVDPCFIANAPQAEKDIKDIACAAYWLADALCDELAEQEIADNG